MLCGTKAGAPTGCKSPKSTKVLIWAVDVTLTYFDLFPTLTCGVFVFSSVSARLLLLPSSSSLTHWLTHSPSLTHLHSLTHSLGCTPWRPLGSASFAWQTLSHSLKHSLTPTHTMQLLRGRRGTMCIAKGSDVRPGVPWAPPLLRGRRGTMCIAKGLDVRPGVPRMYALRRGGTVCIAKGLDVHAGRLFCVAGTLTLTHALTHTHSHNAPFAWQARDNALPRGRMYALASLGLRRSCVAGVGPCALPRGRMYALAWLRLFCVAGVGQCALPRGWMYALASLGLCLFCVAGLGQCALPRGWMYALASLRLRLFGLRFFCVTAMGQCALPRGRMYALASPGLRLFCVAGVGQCALPKVGCTPWRPFTSSSFAWQAWVNVVGCTPWRPVPWAPPLWRGTHSHTHSRTHSHSLTQCSFCEAGGGQCALPRDRTWQAWDNVHGQGVGCTPWRPLGSASFAWQAWDNVYAKGLDVRPGVPCAPLLLRGRRGTMCIAKGSDVRPGVPWDNVHGQGVGCTPWRCLGSASLTHSLPLLTPSLTHFHISHAHTPHSHHSLTFSLTHLCMHIHAHTHTHLLRNSLSNNWCGTHQTCNNTLFKPDERNWLTRRESLCEENLSVSLQKYPNVLMQLSLPLLTVSSFRLRQQYRKEMKIESTCRF